MKNPNENKSVPDDGSGMHGVDDSSRRTVSESHCPNCDELRIFVRRSHYDEAGELRINPFWQCKHCGVRARENG